LNTLLLRVAVLVSTTLALAVAAAVRVDTEQHLALP